MIKKKYLSFLTLVILVISTFNSYSQVVYTPVESRVYNFLERLSLKGIIDFNNEVLPKSRKKIAEHLTEAKEKMHLLNDLEKSDLQWYEEEYSYEMKSEKERWYLINYTDSVYVLRVSPFGGYGISGTGKNNGHTRWPGVTFYFTYSEWFGGSFQYVDYGEFGDNVDKDKNFSIRTGHFIKTAPDGIEFSDVKGSINFNWDWGSISLIKDYTMWGHGKFGNLILSDKAASFPQIRFIFEPYEWLRFYYIHGWLNSLVYDSSFFQYNNINSSEPFLMKKYIDKYIAINMLTISPWKWFDLSVGNSFVYSGDLRPEAFIPFMYYKVMDHNTGREGLNDGNGIIFFDMAAKYPETFLFYTTFVIDVLNVRDILDGNWKTSWFGYTAGAKKTDLFIENLDLTIEYTRTDPWLYKNEDETTTYEHLNYSLGHWLGQNADQLRIQLDYSFIRGLRFSLFNQFIRKGGLKDIALAYSGGSREKFLYRPLRKDFIMGINCEYEPLHDLFIQAEYIYSDISDEDPDRTELWMLGEKNSYAFTVRYGL